MHITRQHSNEKRKQKVIIRGERFKPIHRPPVHQVYKFADRHKKFKVRQVEEESDAGHQSEDLKQQKKRKRKPGEVDYSVT